MNSSDQTPKKIPTWAFIATDVVLLGTAWYIAQRSAQPLSTQAVFGIVACVIVGAIVGLVPLIIDYERQKNEILDERQRALEGLARTVSASAEQISIAAGGMHEIAELAQKNLRQAEQLPHKLQDKIAEFHAQLASANDTEKEELEKELVALRTTESERLETISDRISKSTAEWSKLEAATQQHLAAANESLAKLTLGTANAIGKAQAAAEHVLLQARTEAARGVGEASGQATRALEAARISVLAELDSKLAAATAGLADRLVRDIAAQLAPHLAAGSALAPRVQMAAARPGAPALDRMNSPVSAANGEKAAGDVAALHAEPAAQSDLPPASPQRPRKSSTRRAEPAASSSVISAALPETTRTEPAPVWREAIPEVVPVAPHTSDPFSSSTPAGDAAGSASATLAAPPVAAETAKPARKRAAKNADAQVEPEPALNLDPDASQLQNGGATERVLSSDGATRLLVTAYIGIGNRLFIRGDGAGLSWDKGVPLHFVSIGKWRWETNEATGPVRFKLFKNDEAECAALGAQSLDPGHQQELTAAF